MRIGAALVYFHDWASAATVSRGWARCSREAQWLPAQSRGSTRAQPMVEPVSAVSVIDVVGGAACRWRVGWRPSRVGRSGCLSVSDGWRSSCTTGPRTGRCGPRLRRRANRRRRCSPRNRRSCARWLRRSRRPRWDPPTRPAAQSAHPAWHPPAVHVGRPLNPCADGACDDATGLPAGGAAELRAVSGGAHCHVPGGPPDEAARRDHQDRKGCRHGRVGRRPGRPRAGAGRDPSGRVAGADRRPDLRSCAGADRDRSAVGGGGVAGHAGAAGVGGDRTRARPGPGRRPHGRSRRG